MIDGKQTRSCNDYDTCGTTKLKPKTEQLCDYGIKNETDSIETTATQSYNNEAENIDAELQQQENNQETVKNVKKYNGYWIISVLLIIIGTGIFFFYKNKKHKEK